MTSTPNPPAPAPAGLSAPVQVVAGTPHARERAVRARDWASLWGLPQASDLHVCEAVPQSSPTRGTYALTSVTTTRTAVASTSAHVAQFRLRATAICASASRASSSATAWRFSCPMSGWTLAMVVIKDEYGSGSGSLGFMLGSVA